MHLLFNNVILSLKDLSPGRGNLSPFAMKHMWSVDPITALIDNFFHHVFFPDEFFLARVFIKSY